MLFEPIGNTMENIIENLLPIVIVVAIIVSKLLSKKKVTAESAPKNKESLARKLQKKLDEYSESQMENRSPAPEYEESRSDLWAEQDEEDETEEEREEEEKEEETEVAERETERIVAPETIKQAVEQEKPLPETEPAADISHPRVQTTPLEKTRPSYLLSEKSHQDLRQAIVWSEILAPPLALRDE